MSDILTRAKAALDEQLCAICGNTEQNHPYVHSFRPVSLDDKDTAKEIVLDLMAEVERLRRALEPFSKEASWWFCKNCDASETIVEKFSDYEGVITCGDLYRARAALEGDKP